MKYRAVTRAIEHKVPGEVTRTGKERKCWAVLDGQRVLRVSFPSVHSPSDLPPGTLHAIRKQLRLDRDDFDRFVHCPMTGTEYELHLRTLQALDEL